MSDEKNVLKLSGDHIDFNLNLKINLSPLFHAQNAFIPKQTVPETFDFLVSLVPYNISVRPKIQGEKII